MSFQMNITGKRFCDILLYLERNSSSDEKPVKIPVQTLANFIVKCDASDPLFQSNSLVAKHYNISTLIASLKSKITKVSIYSVPLSKYQLTRLYLVHTFVIFETENPINHKKMWWSLEKNRFNILLQQSLNKADILNSQWDEEENKFVERLTEIVEEIYAEGCGTLEIILQALSMDDQLIDSYHAYLSNCQKFASYIFKKINSEGKSWKAPVSGKTLKPFMSWFFSPAEIHPGIDQSIVGDSFLFCNEENIYKQIQAIMNGNLEELKNTETDSTHRVDYQGYTLLEWASAFSRKEIEEYLQKEKISTNLSLMNVFFIKLQYGTFTEDIASFSENDYTEGKNGNGDTALHLALYGIEMMSNSSSNLTRFGALLQWICKLLYGFVFPEENNRQKIMEWLIDSCDVTAKNKQGETPLHLATKLKCPIETFTKILEKNKQNINEPDWMQSYTALHWAVYTRSTEKARLLLNQTGVDVNALTKCKQTPLHLVAANRWDDCPKDILEKLAKTVKLNDVDNRGFTSLQLALQSNCEKLSSSLLDFGADVNTDPIDFEKMTPLHLVAMWSNISTDLAKKIVEKVGPTDKIDAMNRDGRTPLHCAVTVGSVEMTNLLLAKGAKVTLTTEDEGYTVLHLAAQSDTCLELVEILWTQAWIRENIDVPDGKGYTPLHKAVESNKIGNVQVFLQYGADNKKTTKEQYTPLHIAVMKKNNFISLTMVQKLLEIWPNDINALDNEGYTPLHSAIDSESTEIIEELLKNNANVNVATRHCNTALHLASVRKNISSNIFKQIVERSQNINATDDKGYTPLHNALRYKIEDHAVQLLDKGAKADIATRDKLISPLHQLAKKWNDCSDDLIKKLLKNGAYINAQDCNGETPLDLAAHEGFQNLRTVLQNNGAKIKQELTHSHP